ncbi:hypothetical protein [Rahnella sikkimica]|uniref:Autotransporter outer membrane beta-barrel domain-containing protein n=1 Tax=Rahnella sikkimica TaxID=1805933 RepID=A0A2L1UXL0_9GAMM|nr:hypothetical protein [Rahnella sikkimica]AVF37696.1 hypothetical protein BV494_22530 [Rahnella sikkimica]
MKKNTPYTCHTKKLMLASLISVAVTNHVQAQDLDYSNQTYPDMTTTSVSGDLNFTADNSQFIRGLSVTASDNLVAELNGTTVSDEAGYNNARINLAATNGDLTLTLNNYDVLPANKNPGVGLRIDAYNGDVNVDMSNNQNPRGFNIYGGNATIKVTDTLLGATGQIYPTGTITEVGAMFTGGKAELDISNSQVLGNVLVSIYNTGGSTILNLNEDTVMNGNATMTGGITP